MTSTGGTSETTSSSNKQAVRFEQNNYAFPKNPGTTFELGLVREGSTGDLWVNVWLKPGWQEPSAEGYTNQMATVHWKSGESGVKTVQFIQQPTANPIEYLSAYIGKNDVWGGMGDTEMPGVLESLIAIHIPTIEPAFQDRETSILIRGLMMVEDQGDPISRDFTLKELADTLPPKTPYEEIITGDGVTTEWQITHGKLLPNPDVEFWYEQAPIDLYWEPGGFQTILFRPILGLAAGVEVLVRIS